MRIQSIATIAFLALAGVVVAALPFVPSNTPYPTLRLLPIALFAVGIACMALDELPAWLDKAFSPVAAGLGLGFAAALLWVAPFHVAGQTLMFCVPLVGMAFAHWDAKQARPFAKLRKGLRDKLNAEPAALDEIAGRELVSEREVLSILRAVKNSRTTT